MSNNIQFTIDNQPFKIISARIHEQINQPYWGECHLRHDGLVGPQSLMGKSALLFSEVADIKRYFHLIITSVTTYAGDPHSFIVKGESPMCGLKHAYRSRSFSNITTRELINRLVTNIHWNGESSDHIHEYVEQHQCSDMDLFQRLIYQMNLVYYCKSDEYSTKVYVEKMHYKGDITSFPFLPGRAASDQTLKINAIEGDDHTFYCVTNILSLQPHGVFSLEGHPTITYNREYRILENEHVWQENDIAYQHHLTVEPANSVNSHHVQHPTNKVPYISVAVVQSNPHTLLNDQGKYHIQPLEMSKRLPNERQYAVPMSGSYVGNDFGMHFPLAEHTEVLIARMDGYVDKPFIMGAWYNSVHINPITEIYPDQHVIKTQGKNSLLMNDDKISPSLCIETALQEQSITFEAETNAVSVNMNSQRGCVMLEADQDIALCTKASLNVAVEGEMDMNAKSLQCIATDNDITFHCGNDQKMVAQKNVNIKMGNHLSITADKSVAMDIKKEYYLSCQGNSRMNAEHGKMLLSSSQSTSFLSDQINIIAGGSTMCMKNNGIGILSAQLITINVDAINIKS